MEGHPSFNFGVATRKETCAKRKRHSHFRNLKLRIQHDNDSLRPSVAIGKQEYSLRDLLD